MANVSAVNETRELIVCHRGPSGFGSATMEEHILHMADAGVQGAALATPQELIRMSKGSDKQVSRDIALGKNPEPVAPDPNIKDIAHEQGTRVWNHWDDETAKQLQTEAGERPLDPDNGFVPDESDEVVTTGQGVTTRKRS